MIVDMPREAKVGGGVWHEYILLLKKTNMPSAQPECRRQCMMGHPESAQRWKQNPYPYPVSRKVGVDQGLELKFRGVFASAGGLWAPIILNCFVPKPWLSTALLMLLGDKTKAKERRQRRRGNGTPSFKLYCTYS